MKGRWIDLVLVVDVANVIGAQRNVAQVQRTLRVSIDLSDFSVLNLEEVNFERVDRLERILPALLAQWYWVRFLSS